MINFLSFYRLRLRRHKLHFEQWGDVWSCNMVDINVLGKLFFH